MSGTSEHTISNKQFLTMSANLLAKTFFEGSRTDSKRYFQELQKGTRLGLSTVKMEDESTLEVYLRMNCEEYCGKMSFSAFKNQLRLLLQRFVQAVDGEEPLEVLTEQGGGSAVFKLPILHADEDVVNALVLGWKPLAAGQLELCLMYLDPEQFRVDSQQQA